MGREMDQAVLGDSDLADWERHAVQRVSDVLRLGKPDVAIEVLRTRTDRSFASPLYVVQAQALILVGDLEAARATIANGMREVQNPASLLKFDVMASWIDNIAGLEPDGKRAVEELSRINRRFGDDPLALRFGLHRLEHIGDEWVCGQVQDLLAEIAARVPDSRLSQYRLLARNLVERVAIRIPALLIRLLQVFGLGSAEASSELKSYLRNWDERTGILTHYRVHSSETLIGNLGLLQDRVGLSYKLLTALAEPFIQTLPPTTPQALYDEMEIENRGAAGTFRTGPSR
jgi:hypothetical protein